MPLPSLIPDPAVTEAEPYLPRSKWDHFAPPTEGPKISAAEMRAWKAREEARKTPEQREQEAYQRQQTAEWHQRFTASCEREDAMKAQAAAREAEIAELHEWLGCKPPEAQANYIPGFEEDWTIS